MKLRRFLSVLLLSTSLAPAVAFAQVSDGDKAVARQLTLDGYDALEKKDYAGAADRFTRADSLFHAPTMTLGLARAQVGLGKLVSAQEAYSRLVHETLPAGAPPAFTQAIEDGRRELAALGARIPSVIILVRGADAPRVTLDGVDMPNAVLGVRRPVDPGKHVIRAAAARFTTGEVTVMLAEGKTETVTLELVPAPGGAAPLPTASAAPPAVNPTQPVTSPAPLEEPRQDTSTGSVRRPIGFGVFGVGAGVLGVGAGLAGLAGAKHADLIKQCPTSHCPPSLQGKLQPDVDKYHVYGTASTAVFIVGGALAATGLILAVTAPRAKPRAAATVEPILGLGYAGVKGTF